MRGKVSIYWALTLVWVAIVSFVAIGCSSDDDGLLATPQVAPSQSYRGHENDSDSNNLVQTYPGIIGTRLDDCQTCHRGGEVQIMKSGEVRTSEFNPCSYCHLLLPDSEIEIVAEGPGGYEGTLNPYGLAYKQAGRDRDALKQIAGADSDDDGYVNLQEIEDVRYPGDPESMPGQPVVPTKTLTWDDLHTLASHQQFLLMNSHKQEFDSYARYTGVKIADLLAAAGADLSQATSVTVLAPDGYAKDFDLNWIDDQFPAGRYFAGLDEGDAGFVNYPPDELLPEGLVDGGEIPGEQWMMLAYGRDAGPLDESYLDALSGKLEGEGPYRLVVPQGYYGEPGSPDRGSKSDPVGDGLDYDDTKDHNAGLCVRGLVAVRVNPIPAGYEEFDWKNGGFSLLAKQHIIVYGAGIKNE